MRQMQSVCGSEEEKEIWTRKQDRDKATVWGAVSLLDDL